MRVTFVMPSLPTLAGGNRVILEYSNQLQAMGHSVAVVWPAQGAHLRHDEWLGLKARLRMLKHAATRPLQGAAFPWFRVREDVQLVEVPSLHERHLPDSEVVIATFWTTAGWVDSYSGRMGAKFYLLQHYEALHEPERRAQVDATWKLPLRKVVIASWLKELAEREFGEQVYALIPNGINLEQFWNENKVYGRPRRVGMMYHSAEWKGATDGLRALAIVHEQRPDMRAVLFGVHRPTFALPPYVEFHHRPHGERLRRLYCCMDVFLSPSWREGCGLPIMEAMACRCAVVATDSGAVTDYAIPGDTVLLSPPRQPELLAKNILALLDDPERLRRVSERGHDTIQSFTWESAARQLEAAFRRALEESSARPGPRGKAGTAWPGESAGCDQSTARGARLRSDARCARAW
ncbi:MAG: glycosyltransferase family 4 protein [Anaerolineae bacterium]|nr:glycosyltransferase family 4 protein [Anaerolineae bacterium]